MNDDLLSDISDLLDAKLDAKIDSFREEFRDILDIKIDSSENRLTSLIENKSKGLRKYMDRRFEKLESKVDNGFASIGDTVTLINDNIDEFLDNHERRIKKLEAVK